MFKGVRTLIIEDQKETADFIAAVLRERLLKIDLIGVCTTVKDSIESIKELKPELVLMDIELPDGNAFEVLDVFRNADFEVIFITGHSEFMEKALAYFAFSYITKPFGADQLVGIIDRFLGRRERLFTDFKIKIFKDFVLDKGTKFLLHLGAEHISIDLKSVIFCKADGNYTHFYMDSGDKLMASHPLKYYEKLLTHKMFLRVNRFNLINTSHIKSIYKKEAILLSDNSSIQISARHKGLLSNLIKDINRL